MLVVRTKTKPRSQKGLTPQGARASPVPQPGGVLSMEPHTEKLEFFRKLGYSREDVVRVLAKLGQGALVNDILQELIQMGSRPQAGESYGENPPPKLVARGSGGTADLSTRLLGADPEDEGEDADNHLRPIVIDGSNVAMSHGNKEIFSCRGIRLAVDWFRERGHNYIKVFVPSWRKEPPRSDTPISEQHILEELEKQAVLVYTPSRKVNGKRVVCYDDRYIVKVAYEKDGIIVSNDNYRDLQSENPEWKWFIEQRLLMFSFVSDKFMPPDDPLGRHGPTLSNFLSKKPKLPQASWQHCPYGRKCTYGSKCKFYHPERLHQIQLSVADELRAKTRALPGSEEEPRKPGPLPSLPPPSPSPEALWSPAGSVSSCSSFSNSSPGSSGTEGRGPSGDRSLRGTLARSWEDCAPGRRGPPAGDIRFLESQLSRLAFGEDSYGSGSHGGVGSAGIRGGMNTVYPGCNLSHSDCRDPFQPPQHSADCGCWHSHRFQEGALPTAYAGSPLTGRGAYRPASRGPDRVLPRTFVPSDHPSAADLQQSRQQTVHCPQPPTRDPFPYPTHTTETWGTEQVQKPPPAPSFRGDSSWRNRPFRRVESYPHSPEYKCPALGSASAERARVRTALYNIFPQAEVDRVMSLFPDLVDITSLMLLIEKNRRLCP
ncbi:probable ribonuclease ZC3H12D [Antechinus flavipes]|uniref:probable ribonuclease ZC3H12D n=1 Tax=Antechinus flavipes TaxID=38775 RepID=UPI0022355B80|nr:probable ribonuclease ZC3H12D [Antechinus flavipes]